MKISLVLVGLLIAAPLAAQQQSGWPIGALSVPVVTVQTNSATIYGWTFHTGGAAITSVRFWIDCHPWIAVVNQCASQSLFPYYFTWPRSDVTAAYPTLPVPENSGIMTGLTEWFSLTDGPHWLYAAVTDTQRGKDGWALINPICFVKWGGHVFACR